MSDEGSRLPLCLGANGWSIMQADTSSHQPHSQRIVPLKTCIIWQGQKNKSPVLCVCFPADVFVTFQLNPLTRQCHSPSPTQPATSTDKQQAPLSNLLCESVQMLPSFPCSQIIVTIFYLTTLLFKTCCSAHLNSFSSLAGKPTCSFSNGVQKLRKFFNFKIFFQAFSSYYETRR